MSHLLLASVGVFCLALFFRTIDGLVCPCIPIGTHFLRHILVGLVLYLAMRALIVTGAGDRGGDLMKLHQMESPLLRK